MEALLEVKDLYANIGQFSILQGVSLSVQKNAINVILGRNGAGKSTTLRTIMGYVRPLKGTIQLDSTNLSNLTTYQIARKGIGYMPEDANIFANLTVEENLLISMPNRDARTAKRLSDMRDLFPDLTAAWNRQAGTLSGGQRQMMALASVLVSQPTLVLIDEPSKGLSPLLVERIGDALVQLRTETTIVLVEQNFFLAKRTGDYVTVLDDGQTVYTGDMQALASSEDLLQHYLGLQLQTKDGMGL